MTVFGRNLNKRLNKSMTHQTCPKIHSATIVHPQNILSGITRRVDQPAYVQGSLCVPLSLSSIAQPHVTQGRSCSCSHGPRIIQGSHYLKPSYRAKVYPRLELNFGRNKSWQGVLNALHERTGCLLDFNVPWEICNRILFVHQTKTGLLGYLHRNQRNSKKLAKPGRPIDEMRSVMNKGHSPKNCRIFLNFSNNKSVNKSCLTDTKRTACFVIRNFAVSGVITKSLSKLFRGTAVREQMRLKKLKKQESIKLTSSDRNEKTVGNRISITINASMSYEQLTSFAFVRQNPFSAYIPLHSDYLASWLQVLHILKFSIHSDLLLNCLDRRINLLICTTVFITHSTANLAQHSAAPYECEVLIEFLCLRSNVGHLPIVSESPVDSFAVRHKAACFQNSEVLRALATANHTYTDLFGFSFWVNFLPLIAALSLLWTSTVLISLLLLCQWKTVQKPKILPKTVIPTRFEPKQLTPKLFHPTTVTCQKHSLTPKVKSKLQYQSIHKKDTTVPPIVSHLYSRTSTSCIRQINPTADQSQWPQKNINRSLRTVHQSYKLPVFCTNEPRSIIQSREKASFSLSQENCSNRNNKSHTSKDLLEARKLIKVQNWLVRNLPDLTSSVQPPSNNNLTTSVDLTKKRSTTLINRVNPIREDVCDRTDRKEKTLSHHAKQEMEPGEIAQLTRRCPEIEEDIDQERRKQLIYKWLMDQPDPAHFKNLSITTRCNRVEDTSHVRIRPIRSHHRIPVSNPLGVASHKLPPRSRVCQLPHLSENQNNISAYESSMPVPPRIGSGHPDEVESKMSTSVGCAACCMPKHLTNSFRRKYFHSVDVSIAPRLITLEEAEIARYFRTPPSQCGDSTYCVYRALMSQVKRDNCKTDIAVCTDRTSVVGGTDTMQSDVVGFSFSTQLNTRASDTTSISPDVLGPPSPSFSKSKWMMKRKWNKFKRAFHKLKRTARRLRPVKRLKGFTGQPNASAVTSNPVS